MSLFKKRKDAEPEAKAEAGAEAEEGAEAPAKPKREVHAFRQIPPYEMDEELARRIAMRAYGDDDHDGEPDIPAAQFPG
ncbi:hypothetical protein [Sinomonas mesophila]|uniref:hypothetical protein n=1 Tax=Sinomonas mesophila TaxID=1531955 RepID=UPI001588E635|nr:hypothetical protein [Sinomonas mesophila]